MPKILDVLKIKTVGETVPGELFRLELRGASALCVNVELYEGNAVVAVLRWPHVERPSYFMNHNKNANCLSYGDSWVIEPVYGEMSCPVRYAGLKQHILYLGEECAFLCLGKLGSEGSFDDTEIDITGANGEVPRVVVPVNHWRIWASEEHRLRPGAVPILEVNAEPPVD